MAHDQIIALWRLGWRARKIGRELGIDRDTVRAHLRAAGCALERGRPKSAISRREVPTDPSSSIQTPPFSVARCPPTQVSSCEPFRSIIEERVGLGQSAQVIWQDLIDGASFCGSYDAVKRFVRKLKAVSPEVFAVIPTSPGYEAQVDYGLGAPTLHPVTGKPRRPRLFCMKLSHSRKAFRKVVWESSTKTWCELHEEAFRFFGGVPEIVRLDNLKEGVLKADIYDPELNPLYAAMLAHYGAVAIPCRVATPRHKGKVESEVKYTQNALKGRRFETLEAHQSFMDTWGRRWADTRIHGTIKRQVNELFETEERSALKPLPPEGFPILQIVTRKVHPDGHIAVGKAFYSAPHRWVGKEVTVHVGRCFIDLFHPSTGERLARHLVVTKGTYHTTPDHLPDAKRTDRLHERIIDRAAAIGPATRHVIEQLLKERPHHAIRAAQGVLSLTRTYSKEAVERAAQICAERKAFSFRAVKNLLERNNETPLSSAPALIQQHDCIRPLADYQLLWASTQKGNLQ